MCSPTKLRYGKRAVLHIFYFKPSPFYIFDYYYRTFLIIFLGILLRNLLGCCKYFSFASTFYFAKYVHLGTITYHIFKSKCVQCYGKKSHCLLVTLSDHKLGSKAIQIRPS